MSRASPISLDQRVSAVAISQCGAVSRSQLAEIGLDRRAIARRVACGLLVRVYPRVFLVGGSGADRGAAHGEVDASASSGLTPAWTAVLQVGVGAAVSAHWALFAYGLCARPQRPVEVVSSRVIQPPPGFGHRRLPWLGAEDVGAMGGLPVTNFGLALATKVHIEAAQYGAAGLEHQITAILNEAAFKAMLDLDRLNEIIEQMPRLRGRRVLLSGIASYQRGAAGFRSQSEQRLYEALVAAGLPAPTVGMPVATPVGALEVDFLWRKERVVVEVDGPGHARPTVARSDRQRDAALAREGFRVERIPTWMVWNRPRQAVDRVRWALNAGGP